MQAPSAGWHDVLHFSALPTLRLPIIFIWQILKIWFANAKVPSIDAICKILGIGGAQGSAAQRLGKFLLSAEASCAEKQQQTRKLQGLIECDGTSIRSWKVPNTTNLCYWQLYGACERGHRVVNLYDIRLAISRNFGKPPPGSYTRIASTSFFEDVSYRTDSGQRTCLISDGAPCYDKIASCTGLLKRSVNHSKGEFERKERLHNKVISVHTGSIDNVWKMLKEHIPNSVNSKSGGHPNAVIMKYCRQWQWRYENASCLDLCKITAKRFRS